MGHFTARSLHSLKPLVTSQPIQNKFNLTSVTSQPIIYLQVCVLLINVVILISFIDPIKKRKVTEAFLRLALPPP